MKRGLVMRMVVRFALLAVSIGGLAGKVSSQQRAGVTDSVLALVAAYDRAWLGRDSAAVGLALSARSELGVRISGPVAVVSSRWKGRGSFRGAKFSDDQRCGQVWLRAAPGWQVLSEHCVDIVRDSPPSN
jgi:hypothetical protein